jgi:class 3 adenylate cyclase
MAQQIQFCTSADGTRIAYVLNEGGPGLPLVITNGWGFALEDGWGYPAMREQTERLLQKRSVLRYERRGIGASHCDAERITLENEVADLAAVVDCAGLQSFGIWAYASAIAARYAAEHADRVEKLILWAPFLRGSDTMFRDVRSMVDVIQTNWSIARRALCTLTYPSGPAHLQRWHSDMLRDNLTPEVAARFLTLELEVDLTDVLPRVDVETLVVALRGQRGLGNATDVAALLPKARMTAFDGDNSLVFTDPLPVTEVIEGFLDEGRPLPQQPMPAATAGDVLTVLFTDITDSTALTQRLGDAEAQELVRAHNTIVRDALGAHGGAEIKHTGDGIMASFATASGALECAIAIQQAVEEDGARAHGRAPLQVHIGLNAGEPVAEDGDIFGTSVQLARRVCDAAGGGEILASDVVRQLAAGKGFLFAARGDAALRGFEDPVRLYEVQWRE